MLWSNRNQILKLTASPQFVAHPLSQQLLKMEWQKGDAAYLGAITFNGWIYTFARVNIFLYFCAESAQR